MDCTHASYPAFSRVISYVCPCMCVYADERVSTVHVGSGLCYTSCIVAVFKEMGQNQRFLSSSRFGFSLKVWRMTPAAWALFGFVCKTLHRQLLWGKWQQRWLLKFGKNEGWGLGCSNISVLCKPWYGCTWEQAVLYGGSFQKSESSAVSATKKSQKWAETLKCKTCLFFFFEWACHTSTTKSLLMCNHEIVAMYYRHCRLKQIKGEVL